MTSIPDEFLITSLDVVIYRREKMGEGRFGRVFQAQWQDSRVAVKELKEGVSLSVSGCHHGVPFKLYSNSAL